MTQNRDKRAALLVILASAVLGVIVGCIFLFVDVDMLFWFIFLLLGLLTLLLSIPEVVRAFSEIGGRYGIPRVVLYIVQIVLGCILIFLHKTVALVIVGAFLVALPIVRVVLSEDRRAAVRGEILWVLLGGVMILLGQGEILHLAFRVIGWIAIGLSGLYALFGSINVMKG